MKEEKERKTSGKRRAGEKCIRRKRKSILSFIFVSFTSMSRWEQIGGSFVVILKIERLWGEKYKKKLLKRLSSLAPVLGFIKTYWTFMRKGS